MGDRAVIFFHDAAATAPGIYLHNNGSDAAEWLKTASHRFRAGDADYAAARFCGICHEMIDGNLSLGLVAPPETLSEDNLRKQDAGDHGVFLVNVDTGEVRRFSYGEWRTPFTITMGRN